MTELFEYFADFILVPIYIFAFWYISEHDFYLIAAGVFGWTLMEYLIHRFAFHARDGSIKELHDDHHRFPKKLMGNKPWHTAGCMVTLAGIFFIFGGINDAANLTIGLLLGYLAYSTIHIRLHHGAPGDFSLPVALLYRHHATHHRGGNFNFGVTTSLWDWVFQTKR